MVPSMSSAVVSGDVHCRNVTNSGTVPSRAARTSRTCSSAASDEAVSPLIDAGRVITSAPSARAAAAISSSSVETMTRSTSRAARAAAMVCAINGLPARARTFLRGTPLEPPRAGMMAMHPGAVVADTAAAIDQAAFEATAAGPVHFSFSR